MKTLNPFALRLLMKYADFFNVSLAYIFGRCDERTDSVRRSAKSLETHILIVLSMCFDRHRRLMQKKKERSQVLRRKLQS